MSVFIDGATLSSLLYSHVNSEGNQEGVLLGQVVRQVKEHISDSQINNSQLHTFTYVSSHIPWPRYDRVYTRGGVPIMEKLAALLGDSHTKVVGWYSFRRNSTLRMSMKERTVHKHLQARFSPDCPQNFVFLMCIHSGCLQRATHSVDHFFATITPNTGVVTKLPVTVTNLGDTVHTQYSTLSHAPATQASAVHNIVTTYRSQFVSETDDMLEVEKINNMSTALNTNLQKLSQQVSESEQQAGDLEREVAALRSEIQRRENARRREEGGGGEGQEDDVGGFPQRREAWGAEIKREEGWGGRTEPFPTPSIDELLSLAPTLPPSITTTSPHSSTTTTHTVLNPAVSLMNQQNSPPTSLQSVVDVIRDEDDDDDEEIKEVVGVGAVLDRCLAPLVKGSDNPTTNTTNESETCGSVHVYTAITTTTTTSHIMSNTAGSNATTERSTISGSKSEKTECVSSSTEREQGAGGGSKKQDHFAFVDNLLTSEHQPSAPVAKKTSSTTSVMPPKGGTLTYNSARTTRFQNKGPGTRAGKETSGKDVSSSSLPSMSSSLPANRAVGVSSTSSSSLSSRPGGVASTAKDRAKSRNSPTRPTSSSLPPSSQAKRESSPKAESKGKAVTARSGGVTVSSATGGEVGGEKRRSRVEGGSSSHGREGSGGSRGQGSSFTRQDSNPRCVKLDPANFSLGTRGSDKNRPGKDGPGKDGFSKDVSGKDLSSTSKSTSKDALEKAKEVVDKDKDMKDKDKSVMDLKEKEVLDRAVSSVKAACGRVICDSEGEEGEKADGGPEDTAKNGTLNHGTNQDVMPRSLSPVF